MTETKEKGALGLPFCFQIELDVLDTEVLDRAVGSTVSDSRQIFWTQAVEAVHDGVDDVRRVSVGFVRTSDEAGYQRRVAQLFTTDVSGIWQDTR